MLKEQELLDKLRNDKNIISNIVTILNNATFYV